MSSLLLSFCIVRCNPAVSFSCSTVWITSLSSFFVSEHSLISSAYLRLLNVLPPILTPKFKSFNASLVTISVQRLNRYGDSMSYSFYNLSPLCIPRAYILTTKGLQPSTDEQCRTLCWMPCCLFLNARFTIQCTINTT